MAHSQLEDDLMKNAHDRLVLWRKDTVMRCEVVDLPTNTQISMIYTLLVGELVQLTTALKMGEEDFAVLMQYALSSYRTMKRDFENKSVEDEKIP